LSPEKRAASAAPSLAGLVGSPEVIRSAPVSHPLTSRVETWVLGWTHGCPFGGAVFDAELRCVAVNDTFARLTGLPREAHLGRALLELLPGLSPDAPASLRRVLATGAPVAAGELVLAPPGQAPRRWAARGFRVEGPSGELGVGLAIEELAARPEPQERLELLFEAKEILSTTLDDRLVLDRLVHLLTPRLADFCVIDVLDDADQLQLAAVGHRDPDKVAIVREMRRHDPPSDADRVGAMRVTRSGRAELFREATDEVLGAGARSEEHLQLMRALGLRSLMVVPMRTPARALGAVTFVSTDPHRRYDEDDLAFAQALADRAALALDNAILHRRERKRAERARLLAEAGAMLVSSLDYTGAAERVARLLVPAMVDSCAIDLLDEQGRPSQFVAADADPEREALILEQRRRYPPRLDTHPVFAAIRGGETQLVLGKPEAVYRAMARDEEHLRVLLALAVPSVLVVPLIARGKAIGGMAIGHHQATFGADDVAFFEDLARRAALALDNARLHDAEHRARLSAEQANRTKDEFLGIVSHELRTPLNAVLGWASLLQGPATDPAQIARGLATIERNARAQVKIIEDILDVSRIVAGKLAIELIRVDPAAALRAAIESTRLAAESKGVALEESIAGDVPPILGDADRLQQVFGNLLANAVKFTPARGRVRAPLAALPGAVRLDVIDTGVGIEPAALPRVFDRFWQADSSRTRRHTGLGLGLAIVQHLVELHGGRVSAASEGAGKGARFTVLLPVAAASAEAEPARAGEQDAPPQSIERVRVLVVDDEPDAREVVATILASSGAVVRAVGSADAAVGALAEFAPDVLLSDIAMPGEDGFALLRRVRSLPSPHANVAAVAVTAFAADEDAARALAAGFFAHLPKPIEPARVLAAVARAAGRAAR
jgi:signal transduction histidine kinase/CheY-like chemotaxis protein